MSRHTYPSLAERCRRHREEFTYGLARGLTPKEAREQLDRLAQSARMAEVDQRLAAKRAGTLLPSCSALRSEGPNPWMPKPWMHAG